MDEVAQLNSLQDRSGWEQDFAKPTKKKGRGGFLTSIISEAAGGLGGGVGFLLGGPIGAGLLGGVGSTLGSALEQKVRDDEVDWGKATREGAFSAAMGALPVGKVLKGGLSVAKAGVKPIVQKTTAKTVANEVPELTPTGGFMRNLTTQGQQMQARGLGISGGNKVGPKELIPQDTEKMLETLRGEGIKLGNANSTSRDLNARLNDYGKTISKHFRKNDAPLQAADTKILASNFLDSVPTTDPSVLKQAMILADDLQKNVKSTSSLWDFRKSLDDRIPASKFMDATTSNKVLALKLMRDYVSKELGNVPGMSNYHALAEIKPFLGKGMRELNQPNGGIVGRVLSSGPIQKVEQVVGRGVEKAGKLGTPEVLDELATGVNPVLKRSVLNVASRELTGRGLDLATAEPTEEATQSLPSMSENSVTPLLNQLEESPNPYDPMNARAALQRIREQGGKEEDIAKYLANVKLLNEIEGLGQGKPLSAEAAKVVSNAQIGVQALDDFETALEKDPSLATKRIIPGRGLFGGFLGGKLGTSGVDAAANQIVDVIARLRTGAAITNDEAKRFETFIPQAGDPESVRRQKVNYLKRQFQMVAQRSGSQGTDLEQAVTGF